MTVVQVWVLMALFGSFGAVLITLVLRSIDTKFDDLSSTMDARFDAVDARFDAVDTRFDGIDRRIDGLDRDVHMLVHRAIGGDAA